MNHEGRRVHDLASHTDVSLADQNTSVVHGLGKTELEHLGLKSTIHQLSSAQLENVVKLLLLLRHQSQTSHTTDDGSTLEDAAGVLLVQSQQFTSSLEQNQHTPIKTYLANLSKNQLHTPDFTLAAETVLSTNAEFLVQTLALVGTTRGVESETI